MNALTIAQKCWQGISTVLLSSRRLLCLVLPFTAIYVFVGATLYGQWWFGFILGGRILHSTYWKSGFIFLLTQHFYWTLSLSVLILIAAFAVVKMWGRLTGILDRHFVTILFTPTLVLFVTVLLLYNFERRDYALLNRLNSSFETFFKTYDPDEVSSLPRIGGPYDFIFIDEGRANALYSQLEPQMIETERTVKKDRAASGKVSAGIGTVNGQVEGKNETAESSSFVPPKSSVQRKCLEVMRLLDSKMKLRYYSSGLDWLMNRRKKTFREEMHCMHQSALAGERQPCEVVSSSSTSMDPIEIRKEMEKEVEAREKQYSAELQAELKSLSGFVIVDGDFDIVHAPHTSTISEEFLAGKPAPPIRFYATLRNEELNLQPLQKETAKRVHVRMFATVINPLNKDGMIQVRPLAIF